MNALLRAIPSSFAQAIRTRADAPDVDLARRQHEAYAEALAGLGFSIELLEAEESSPDSPFVEDTAVIARGRALVTRSAAPSRAGEHEAVARALQRAGLEVVRLDHGTVDGGDVLQVGHVLLVGQSRRTDDDGVEGLRRAFAPVGLDVRPVVVPEGMLHLKVCCSSPAEGVLLLAEGTVELDPIDGVKVVRVPNDELHGANTVGANGRVLVPARHPATVQALRDVGLEPVVLDMSEIQKADGALTCLSLRWP